MSPLEPTLIGCFPRRVRPRAEDFRARALPPQIEEFCNVGHNQAAAAVGDWIRRNQLIRDIEVALCDVQRGAGLTLHEAVAFEVTDYCTPEERACIQALDPKTCWQDIPDSALVVCMDRWAFDAERFRFHLPAYMRWHRRHPRGLPPARGCGLFLQLSIPDHKPKHRLRSEQSFDQFTLDQKRVIAHFLEFMSLEASEPTTKGGVIEQDALVAGLASRAWESYWFRFSPAVSHDLAGSNSTG